MKNKLTPAICLLTVAFGLGCSKAQESDAFAKACAERAELPTFSSLGADPEWWFLTGEMKHLAKGAFWEKDFAEVTEAKEDALGYFVDLKTKLDALGVELIFVPVPAKASIYPDKAVEGATAASVPALAPYLKTFSEAGITVIDIEPELRAAREKSKEDAALSYCKTDAHPAPRTCERLAELVALKLKDTDWAKAAAAVSSVKFAKGEPAEVKIKGDLLPADKKASWAAEAVMATKAGAAGSLARVEPDDASSPVAVIGDSHAQIFSVGAEMLLTGSGIVDHLQADLGFPIYVATTRGSALQAQRQIYKGADFWDGKKVLVWIASARSLTLERRWTRLPRLPK